MTERCKANPCCGEHYGKCEVPLPQDRSGLWFHNTGEYRDNYAVDQFAEAMKAKLAKKRAEGRGGWDRKDECSKEFLSQLLRNHIEKGDPVDVANFCMMLNQRGERIASTQPASTALVERLKERGQAFANQVRLITHLLQGQAYSTTVAELNAFDAALSASLSTSWEGVSR